MEDKKLRRISDFLYWVGIVFAAGVLIKTYIDKSKVPPGVCTINNNRGLLIGAIAFLFIVTVVTWILDYRKKSK